MTFQEAANMASAIQPMLHLREQQNFILRAQ